ncbi:MAG: hypothetical protein LCH30_09420 [Proteobacteria bacterium]|nr:hypothetical protein [Pseudomonadota bacterium]
MSYTKQEAKALVQQIKDYRQKLQIKLMEKGWTFTSTSELEKKLPWEIQETLSTYISSLVASLREHDIDETTLLKQGIAGKDDEDKLVGSKVIDLKQLETIFKSIQGLLNTNIEKGAKKPNENKKDNDNSKSSCSIM